MFKVNLIQVVLYFFIRKQHYLEGVVLPESCGVFIVESVIIRWNNKDTFQ
jgi:hypothetical protein